MTANFIFGAIISTLIISALIFVFFFRYKSMVKKVIAHLPLYLIFAGIIVLFVYNKDNPTLRILEFALFLSIPLGMGFFVSFKNHYRLYPKLRQLFPIGTIILVTSQMIHLVFKQQLFHFQSLEGNYQDPIFLFYFLTHAITIMGLLGLLIYLEFKMARHAFYEYLKSTRQNGNSEDNHADMLNENRTLKKRNEQSTVVLVFGFSLFLISAVLQLLSSFGILSIAFPFIVFGFIAYSISITYYLFLDWNYNILYGYQLSKKYITDLEKDKENLSELIVEKNLRNKEIAGTLDIYRQLFMQIPIPTCIFSKTGGIIKRNQAYKLYVQQELLGGQDDTVLISSLWSKGSLLDLLSFGMTDYDFIPIKVPIPASEEGFSPLQKKILMKYTAYVYSYPLHKNKTEDIYNLLLFVPKDNQLADIIKSSKDLMESEIEELNNRKERLTKDFELQRERAKRYHFLFKSLLNASPDGILITDKNQKSVAVNKRFGELFGIDSTVIPYGEFKSNDNYVKNAFISPEIFKDEVNKSFDEKEGVYLENMTLPNGKKLSRYSTPLVGPNDVIFGRIWIYKEVQTYQSKEPDHEEFESPYFNIQSMR